MSAPKVTVVKQNGGLGYAAQGSDYYSGILFYLKSTSTLPTAFATNQIQSLNSIYDLINLGITGNSADETKCTLTSALTKGSTGDTIKTVFTDPFTNLSTTLSTYAQVSGDSTSTLFAASVATDINNNTATTGWSATAATGTLTLTPPAGYGASLNGATCITFTVTGTIAAGALTLGVTGLGSEQDIIYYHTREAFRIQGLQSGQQQGQIWLGIYKVGGSTYSTFAEVATMQSFTNGQINQMFVYATTTAFATSHVTALQAQATALQAVNQPIQILYQGDFQGTSNISTVTSTKTLNSGNVTCILGQDGANVGARLFKTFGKTIGCGGTTLGAVALASVQQSIISRSVFNLVDTLEYTQLAWANGVLLSASGGGLSALIDSIDALGYVFLRNMNTPVSSALFGGVFFSNDLTSTVSTSDYSNIPNNRVMNKAMVGVYAAINEGLGNNVYFNPDGTLTVDTISYFQHLGDSVIGGQSGTQTGTMKQNAEISDGQTIINPTQNVQSTNTLVVAIKIQPVGVARYITVNIGFTVKI